MKMSGVLFSKSRSKTQKGRWTNTHFTSSTRVELHRHNTHKEKLPLISSFFFDFFSVGGLVSTPRRDDSSNMIGPCLSFLENPVEKEGVHASIFSIVCEIAESDTEMEKAQVERLTSVSFEFLLDPKKQRKIQHSAASSLISLAKRDFQVVIDQIINGLSPSEVPNIEVFWTIREISDMSFQQLAPNLSPVRPHTYSHAVL